MPKDSHQAAQAASLGRGQPGASDTFSGASKLLFEQAMAQTRMAVCLTDPRQEDDPIVFANRAFRELTGYDESEIIGRNCRFLQGPETDPETVAELKRAVTEEDVTVVEILNYRKNGEKFWNALHLGPIYDDQDEVRYFFGSQWDVTDMHTARADERHAKMLSRELSHRMKNMFAVISSIVTATGRREEVPEVAEKINGRIGALGRAYETTLDDASAGDIELSQMIRSVLTPYDGEAEEIICEGEKIRLDPNVISILGLTLHELAINATKYGALSREGGRVKISWEIREIEDQAEDCLTLSWTEAGGPPVEEPPAGKGTGAGLVDRLLAAADGSIETDWAPEGLRATVHLPIR
ncbi:PAS domain-containing protein [Parvularcula oceani]|uniref:PAS domain-containing protein n=1 Tax=Parvularcula oceani TaxID=1247963 RepID=UPI0009DDF94C|nr:PAS domain-containing protein [Parvularcula oceani]